MDLNKKGILISVFQLAEKGELTKLEQKEVISALLSFGMHKLTNKINVNNIENYTNIDDIEEDFKRIRIGSRRLLEQIEHCIDEVLEMIKSQNEYINKHNIDLKNLPKFASTGDDAETLKLIQSLNNDVYNFSQAEKLVGISRQTIKIHADKNLHGLKPITIGKSKYITKENLIEYYRNYFNKHGYGFH